MNFKAPITLCFAIRIMFEYIRVKNLFGLPGNVIFAITTTNAV